MAYRRRRGGPRGRKCVRRRRVRVRGQGMALRCVKYGPKRGSAGRTKRRRSGGRRRYGRKPVGMARRGSKCIRRRRVRVRGHGMALRCVKYSHRRRRHR